VSLITHVNNRKKGNYLWFGIETTETVKMTSG
jgi:hypothetical protein